MRRSIIVALKAAASVVVLFGAPFVGICIARHDARAAALALQTKAEAAPHVAREGAMGVNDFVGVLLPPKMASLSPKTDGRVLSLRVKIGQTVRQGDVLVTFDPREKQHDLEMAKAELGVSKADAAGAGSELAAARKRASRRNATVEVGGQKIALVSGEEAAQAHYDAQGAAARASSAVAKIAQQKAKVDQLTLALEETELRAPFDGVVTALSFEPGMTAHTGDLVARVVGGTGLRARIAVSEDAAPLLKRKRAKLSMDGRTLYANIDQVAFEVEPTSRSFIVEGSVELGADGSRDAKAETMTLAGRAIRASMLPAGEK